MQKDINVVVTYTEGYQQRFTEACLQVLKKRQEGIQQTPRAPGVKQEDNQTSQEPA